MKYLQIILEKIIKIINYNTMKEGTVKFFDETKGFGFISSIDNNKDVFVHNSGLIDSIYENDIVTYDLEQGQKGMNAVNVRLKK